MNDEALAAAYNAVHRWLDAGNDASIVLTQGTPRGVLVIPVDEKRARVEWPTRFPDFADVLAECIQARGAQPFPVCIVLRYEAPWEPFMVERGRGPRKPAAKA